MRKISQREARLALRRVARLENELEIERNAYAQEWPGGVHLGTSNPSVEILTAVKTARRLGHAVVTTQVNSGRLDHYALPLAKISDIS